MESIITLNESLDTALFYGVNNVNILCLKNQHPDVRGNWRCGLWHAADWLFVCGRAEKERSCKRCACCNRYRRASECSGKSVPNHKRNQNRAVAYSISVCVVFNNKKSKKQWQSKFLYSPNTSTSISEE